MQFQNRVVIVTGAGSGIGRGIASAFAAEGAAVAVADIDAKAATETAATLKEAGAQALAVAIDVTSPADVDRAIAETLAEFGGLDVLVNNAGIAGMHGFLETSPEDFEKVLRVNLIGTFLCAQAAAREMVSRGYGRIINVASISGQRAGWGRTAYGTSKAAIIQLTRQIALELAQDGVTANAIAPGPVDTPLTARDHSPETRAAYRHAVPAGRYGQIEEMAAAVLFLASEAAAYINGHTLNIDGGYAAAGIKY